MKRDLRSFRKPLQLQHETIRRLSTAELGGVAGGILTETATQHASCTRSTNAPELSCENCF
jgi:hypothetical protein